MQSKQKLTARQKQLVEENLAIVGWIIKQSIHINPAVYGLNYDDLFQEGCIYLCHAALTYDDTKASFPTYAKRVVQNGLLSYCRSTCRHERIFRPLETVEHESQPQQSGNYLFSPADRTNTMELLALLEATKNGYSGVTRKGIEALALRMQGQTLKQISTQYNSTPRNIGAWISRATRKLQSDPDFLSALNR